MEPNTNTGSPANTPAGTAQSGGTAEQAGGRVRELIDRARMEGRSRLDARKSEAAQTLTSVANVLRQSGTQLQDEQQGAAGDYVQRAADQIERAAQYVQSAEVGQVIEEVERFARRRPALFLGIAFGLGVLGARFLKSSGAGAGEEVTAGGNLGFVDREVPTSVSVESGSVPATPVGGLP